MTTKRALIKELAQRMECTDVAAKKFLNSYIELITEKLSEGEGVSIHYFGKLVPHYQTERPGRNLRTGEECKIRARTSVKFKASEILIQKLFVHIAKTVALLRKEQHVKTLSGTDQGICHT